LGKFQALAKSATNARTLKLFVRGAGPTGFIVGTLYHMDQGSSLPEAVARSGITSVTSSALTLVGVAAGLETGPAAVVMSPALGIAGGLYGAYLGEEIGDGWFGPHE